MTTDAWDDRTVDATGDLAELLGGSEHSFIGEVLVLIAKAQSTPGHLARLESAFPFEARAYRTWMAMEVPPTFRELREKLGAAAEGPARIRVTVTDEQTGDHDSAVITDTYVLTCAGSCYRAGVTAHANGTHVITVKGVKRG
jgi:hypothetical protein